MPIYEYECSSCKNHFEKLESINSEERVCDCPKCGSKAERKVSSNSYHLTGSGFYNTDNKVGKPTTPSCPTGNCCSGGSCTN